jgi:hypothetical protein
MIFSMIRGHPAAHLVKSLLACLALAACSRSPSGSPGSVGKLQQAAGAPARLAIAAAPFSITAGGCSPSLTVSTLDSTGQLAPVAAATSIALSGTSGHRAVYSGAGCTGSPITNLDFAIGESSAVVSLRDTKSGSPLFQITSTGLEPAALSYSVTAGPPAQLGFATPPRNFTPPNIFVGCLGGQTCGGDLIAQLQDAFGNRTPATSAVTITPAAPSMTFHNGAACGSAATTLNLPVGSTEVLFSAIGGTCGGTNTFAMTLAAPGLTTGTQTHKLGAMTGTVTLVSGNNLSVTAGSCSGAITIRLSTGTATVEMRSSSPTTTFYSDATCTTAITGRSVSTTNVAFYFRDTTTGARTFSVGAPTHTAVSITATSAAPTTPLITFTSAPQTVSPSSCSGVVAIQLKDSTGANLASSPSWSATYLSSSPSMGFFSDPACNTGIVPPVTSTSVTRAFYFRDPAGGDPVITVTDGPGNRVDASQTQSIPMPPAALVFTSAPPGLIAGGCTGAITVQLRDSGGLPRNGLPTAVALSTSSAGGAFFSAADCSGSPITSVNVPTSAATATFHYRDTVAGAPVLTANAGAGALTSTQSATVTAGAGVSLAFTSVPSSAVAGDCSGGLTVELRDSFGNPTAGAPTEVNLSTGATGVTFFAGAACAGGAVTQIPVPSSGASATFSFTATQAGSPQLTASAGAGPLTALQSQSVSAAAAASLVFTSAPQTLTAGSCSSAVTLQARDLFGNAAPVGSLLAVALSSSSLGNAFYSDACLTPVSEVSLAAGQSTATFYFRDTAAGAPVLTASAPGLTPNPQQTQSIAPTAVSHLVITSAPQSLTAGSCSAPVTVTARDPFGNPATSGAPRTIGLASSSTGNTFYSDNCVTPVTSVVLPAGQVAVTFRFRDNTAGNPVLTASSGGLSPNATQGQVVNAGAPAEIELQGGAQSLAVDVCSAPVTALLRDSLGNPALGGPTSLTLSRSDGVLQLFSGAGCAGSAISSLEVGASSTSATFSFRGTLAGSVTVSASASGLTGDSETHTLSPGPAAELLFTTAPPALTAGGCSGGLTVQLRDAFANPRNGLPTSVALGSSSPGGAFFSNPACTGTPIASIDVPSSGSTVTFHYRDTAAGSPLLTANAGAGSLTRTQTATVSAAGAASLIFISAAKSVVAGACSGALTVELRDPFGNPTAGAPSAVDLSTVATGLSFHAGAGCSGGAITQVAIPSSGATATFSFIATRSGAPQLTASAGAGPLTAVQSQGVSAAAAAALVFISAPQTLSVGSCSAPVTLQARDAFGNAATVGALLAVALSSDSAGNTFYSDACATPASSVPLAAGASTVTFHFRDTLAGAPVIAVSAPGLAPDPQQSQSIDAATISQLAFTSAPQTLTAGGCSGLVTVQARDAFDNPAAGGAARPIALTSSSPGAVFYSDNCLTPVTSVELSAGQSLVSFRFRDTVAGAPLLTASSSGLTPDATQAQAVSAAAATRLAFVSAPQSLGAGACSAQHTVRAEDAHGNPATLPAGATVSLSASSPDARLFSDACSTLATQVAIAPGGSSASFHFRDTRAGSVTLTAATPGLTDATQAQAIGPGAPSQLVVTFPPGDVPAGSCSPPVQVELRDAFGNLATAPADLVINVTSSSQLFSDACVTPSTGLVIATGSSSGVFHFSDPGAGGTTFTVSSPSLGSVSAPGPVVIPTAPARLSFATAPQTLAADSCSAPVTVRAVDAFGNPAVPAGALTVELLASTGTLTFYSDACSTPVTAAPLINGALTIHFRERRAGTTTLSASATGLSPATQLATVTAAAPGRLAFTSAPQTLAAGDCSGALTLGLEDLQGNAASANAPTQVTFGSSAPTTVFYSDACLTPVSSATVAAGGSSLTLFFRDTRVGAPALTASATALLPATQAQLILAAAPAQLAFATPPQTVRALSCSSAVEVELRDAHGNAAPAPAAFTLLVSIASPTGRTFSDACVTPAAQLTLAAGATRASLFLRDSTAGGTALTVSAQGGLYTAASQPVTVTGAAAGATCAQGVDCLSNHCVDGLCCDTACGGGATDDCEACAVLAGAATDGTCSPVSAGRICRASSGTCNPDPERCDGTARVCPPDDYQPVRLASDAVPTAAAGREYRYNGQGKLLALNVHPPARYASCSPSPADFQVEPATGAVYWTPFEQGSVPLCVKVEDACGDDTRAFQVEVSSGPASTAPSAVADFSPALPRAGEPVQFDGKRSTADPVTTLVSYGWRLGDGTLASGPQPRHSYALGGAYGATLTVHDGLGGSDRVRFQVPVSDALCDAPAPARIHATALSGAESLAVELSCPECEGRVTRWSVSDGQLHEGPVLNRTFGPGRYRVRLLALSTSGCRAFDEVEVVVSRGGVQPPSCVASADRVAGSSPLLVHFSAWAVDPNPGGAVNEVRWLFSDGTSAPGATHSRTFTEVGPERVRLQATGATGLTCTDELPLEVLDSRGAPGPTRISHPEPLVTECGIPFTRLPGEGSADGVTWSLLEAPRGMKVDPSSGAISWMPDSPSRSERVRVEASADGAVFEHDYALEVACIEIPMFLGCGCGSGSGAGLTWGLLALLGLWRSARPRGSRHQES